MRLITLRNKLNKQPLKAVQTQGTDLVLSYQEIMAMAKAAQEKKQTWYLLPLDLKVGQQDKNGRTRIWFTMKKWKKKEKSDT